MSDLILADIQEGEKRKRREAYELVHRELNALRAGGSPVDVRLCRLGVRVELAESPLMGTGDTLLEAVDSLLVQEPG